MIRVTITTTIELDPAEWDLNYGTGPDPSAVRDDLAEYAWTALREQLDLSGITSAKVSVAKAKAQVIQ